MTLNIDAASQYTLLKQRSQLNPRVIMSEDEEKRVLGRSVVIRPRGSIQMKEEINDVTEAIDHIRKSRRSELCKSMMATINGNLSKLLRKQLSVKNPDLFPLTVSDF
jgi:hypothetical protein